MATPPVLKFGTEEQKERFLLPAVRGEQVAALAITEPGAGSDVCVPDACRLGPRLHLRIGAGTDEIMREIIARQMGFS